MTEPALCPFCEIIAGRAPAQMVREWPDAVAFIPLNPVAPPDGHVLVVPREHVPNAVTHPDVTAQTTARAVELAAAHEASNILTSVGKAATQSVFHLHIHVIRRTVGDQLMVPWGTTGDPHAPHWCHVADEQRQHAVRAEWERDHARAAVADLIRVAAYVSRGRRFVDVEPYPDALARKALGALDDATLHAALDRPDDTPSKPCPLGLTDQARKKDHD